MWVSLAERRVRDELQQAAVGVAEIDARAAAAGTIPLHRAELHADAVALEMRDRFGDRSRPLEAEVAVPGRDGDPRDGRRRDAGRVRVQLLLADAVEGAAVPRDDLGSDDVAGERVRPAPVADRDDHVIELHRRSVCRSWLGLGGGRHRRGLRPGVADVALPQGPQRAHPDRHQAEDADRKIWMNPVNERARRMVTGSSRYSSRRTNSRSVLMPWLPKLLMNMSTNRARSTVLRQMNVNPSATSLFTFATVSGATEAGSTSFSGGIRRKTTSDGT